MLRLEQEGMANHRCELSKLVIWAGLESSVRCQLMVIVKPAPTIPTNLGGFRVICYVNQW
ncbi:hypothetical protein [Coleofasciculus sp. G2-EDA-02]|uniref:hypothetical protein n=1 Tax=Coleofasciculus sp. G2-EDA-02 TaxID=3069529 RepID=UPI0032FF540B